MFVVSAREMSFAAAAQHLGLTASAISHGIRSLEEGLACPLFQRHGPKIKLTRAGIRLLPIAEDLLGRMAGLRGEVTRILDEARSLRIVGPEFLCASLLPRVLPDFRESFPSFRFETTFDESFEASVAKLVAREADFQIGLAREETGELVRRDLFHAEFGLYVAPFHALAKATRIEWGELEKQVLLVPSRELLRVLAGLGLDAERSGASIWILPSIECVRELARVGVGVAVLPGASVASMLETGGLQAVEHSGPRLEYTCSAYWQRPFPLSWASEAFLSFLELLAEEG